MRPTRAERVGLMHEWLHRRATRASGLNPRQYHMSRPLRPLAALALTALLGSATASPAQDLFDQVKAYLLTGYGGLSSADRPALVAQGQEQLNAACADNVAACPLDRAYDVLDKEVSGLNDLHSSFERPDDFQDFSERATGGSRLQYGVRLGPYEGDNRLILEVVPGSAAERAGLRRGDSLEALNGSPYTYEKFSASRSSGAAITLDVQRGAGRFQVQLTPGVTSTRELPHMTIENGVAVIRIPTFLAGGGVAQRVHDLVRVAQGEGATGVVVDLRDNGGGDLAECDLAVSAFVPSFARVSKDVRGDSRTLVSHGARRQDGRTEDTVSHPVLWDGPLTVAVNAASGSCSEFFAYEIQYAGRGLVVGQPTAGVANSATQVFPLMGGAGLQLTVTHYVKPDGTAYPERVNPQVSGSDDYSQLARGQDVLLDDAVSALKDAPSVASASDRPRAQRGN